MIAVVCVSDGGGMTFAKRRVSRDKAVVKDISDLADGRAVFMTEYSARLFEESGASVIAVSEPLASAGEDDVAFSEETGLLPYKDKMEALVIYRWNRKYPFETALDIDPEREGMTLAQTCDFVGNAHEKITREIWKRKD